MDFSRGVRLALPCVPRVLLLDGGVYASLVYPPSGMRSYLIRRVEGVLGVVPLHIALGMIVGSP